LRSFSARNPEHLERSNMKDLKNSTAFGAMGLARSRTIVLMCAGWGGEIKHKLILYDV